MRSVSLSVTTAVFFTAAVLAGPTPEVSEIARRNGIVACTDKLMERHDTATTDRRSGNS